MNLQVLEVASSFGTVQVELAFKVAELTERIAVAERLAAVDLADILFLD